MQIGEIMIICLVAAVVLTGTAVLIKNEKKRVREWLLLAVTEAEKALGSGTGKLKLRAVFESFVTVFPLFSKLVSFDVFSVWVDTALDEMRQLLGSNKSAADYVKGGINEA